MIKQTAERTIPETIFYKTETTHYGGHREALVTVLNEKSIPTPRIVWYDRLKAGWISSPTRKWTTWCYKSKVPSNYNTVVVSQASAYEILTDKLSDAAKRKSNKASRKQRRKRPPQRWKDFWQPYSKKYDKNGWQPDCKDYSVCWALAARQKPKKLILNAPAALSSISNLFSSTGGILTPSRFFFLVSFSLAAVLLYEAIHTSP